MTFQRRDKLQVALFGLGSVVIFVAAFVLFGCLANDFHMVHDYISKLGSKGQPLGILWNAIGFGAVGLSFAAFGWSFGRANDDMLLGVCMVVSGLGFALAAIPADFANSGSALSKAHFASICISLAGWCFGLARIGNLESANTSLRKVTNCAAGLAVVPLIGLGAGVLSGPVSHRLVLLIVFGWVTFAAINSFLNQHAHENS